MPKFKIKDIESIYTNADPNDLRPELVPMSINWRHKKGYIQFEPRELAELGGMPDLDVAYPGEGYFWETGIYCTLTNDPFTDNTSAVEYNVLVLVAKRNPPLTQTDYLRRIWINNIDTSSPWKELSFEADSSIGLSHDFFASPKIGDTFFQVENGVLKVYMPHDCFWLGYLKRDANFDSIDHNGWYIDRLIEPFNANTQVIKVNGIDTTNTPPAGTPVSDIKCGTDRRLGIKFNVEILEESTQFLTENILDWTIDTVSNGWEEVNSDYKYYGYAYGAKDEAGLTVYRPTGSPYYEGTDKWHFYEEAFSSGNIVLVDEIKEALQPYIKNSPTGELVDWSTIATRGLWQIEGDQAQGFLSIEGWRISKTDFDDVATGWYLITGHTVGDDGFDANYVKYDMIVTAILDDREEVIIAKDGASAEFTGAPTKYGLRVKEIHIPGDINKRITRLRFYVKIIDLDLDYTLHKEVDLLDSETIPKRAFGLGDNTSTSELLATNIGFLVDEEKPEEYQILIGFRSFVTESGVSIGLPNSDKVRVYHSTLGSVLMPDLIYDQNRLAITGISILNAVANINGRLGTFTDTALYIIQPEQVNDALVFRIEETVHLGVKNIKDVVPVQGGVIANTRNGIYLTNGSSTELLSDPINDLVRTYYSSSSVYYNKFLHELYWRPHLSSEDLYRFRFEDKGWERVNATISITDPGNVDPVYTE